VTGQTEATRVGVTLAIEHEHVRFAVQLLEGCKQGRRLAERKQAGNVRELYGSAHDALLNDLATQHIPDHDTGDAIISIGREGEVGAGDESGSRHAATAHNPCGQLALDGDGLGGCDRPGMGYTLNLHF
jgi:hypothetical protein